MNNEYNIKFFDTAAEAFNYQNTHGGALYVKGEDTDINYEIATYLTYIDDEEELAKLGKYVVVDSFVESIIERKCFTLI
jgi:hypothetical protein